MSMETRYLQRPEGRIAFDVAGAGPLVVAAPGIGDLRSVFRFMVPELVAAGYRVATMDLRGHGESDATFTDYDDVAAGTDMLALIEELGSEHAVLVGNSMGAGAAVWAAAERPDLVSGLALIGPFVRDVPMSVVQRLMLRLGLVRPWGPAAWSAYYAKCYPGRPPVDLPEHRAAIRRVMTKPSHWKAFKATTHTTHAPAEARLHEVDRPALVVMGDRDPDFSEPAAEASLVAERLGGEAVMVPGAGHYPQAEYPEVVNPALIAFLGKVSRGA
jgi:pimeloyl-ACP methyl ester carboxylesterase